MAETKVHFKWNGFSICSDSRDMCLSGDMDYEVYKWCDSMNIDANIFMKFETNSVWRIKDDKQRLMFVLKWA